MQRGNVHDAKLIDRLIRDNGTAVYGDKGYASDAKKRARRPSHPLPPAAVSWRLRQEKRSPKPQTTASAR
jgi:hypothetical protein